MSTDERMAEIDGAVEESLGTHERYETEKDGRSRRRAYEKSIEAVADVAGAAEAHQLAEWIADRIRTKKKLPSSRSARKKGAEICRDTGHSVDNDDWLGV